MINALIFLWLLLFASPSWGHRAYCPPASCESVITHFCGKDNHRVDAVTSLSQESAPLFREKLNNGLWGIKGLASKDQGGIHVWFWPSIREDGKPTHVHHRDAAAAVLNHYAETMLSIATTSTRLYGEWLFAQAEMISDFAARLGGYYSARTSRNLEIDYLSGIHGFQFAGAKNPRTGRFEVVQFDLDSSITAAQANAIAEGRLEIDPIWLEDLAHQIIAVHNQIPESMRGYEAVRIRHCLYSLLTKKHRAILNEELKSAGLHITGIPTARQ